MAIISIQIKGLKSLQKNLSKAPAVVKREMKKAIRNSSIILQRQAFLEVPVATGNLQKKIELLRTGNSFSGGIRANTKYAAYVEFGTRPHVITARSKKALANFKTKEIFGREVRHPGTRPNPFMQRSAKKSTKAIQRQVENAAETVTKSIAK